MNRILIDGDSLTFYSSRETLTESIVSLEDRIRKMFEITNASSYLIYLSDGYYFRHKIYPEYKLSRKKYRTREKNYVRTLKSYLKDEYNATSVKNVEADDMVMYAKQLFPEATICSPDKDVLFQAVGKHYDYRYKVIGKDTDEEYLEEGRWVEVTKDEAERFFWLQCLTGDSTDGVPGVPGIGKVKGNKLLEDVKGNTFQHVVLQAYVDHYGESNGIYNFDLNYRLLHMFNSEEDFIKEGIAPPHIDEDSFIPIQSSLNTSWEI